MIYINLSGGWQVWLTVSEMEVPDQHSTCSALHETGYTAIYNFLTSHLLFILFCTKLAPLSSPVCLTGPLLLCWIYTKATTLSSASSGLPNTCSSCSIQNWLILHLKLLQLLVLTHPIPYEIS